MIYLAVDIASKYTIMDNISFALAHSALIYRLRVKLTGGYSIGLTMASILLFIFYYT